MCKNRYFSYTRPSDCLKTFKLFLFILDDPLDIPELQVWNINKVNPASNSPFTPHVWKI